MGLYFVRIFLITFISIFTLSGCSDSDIKYNGSTTDTNTTNPDTNTTNPDTNTTFTGQFVDAAVEDLNYTCSSGSSALTDSNGSFTCNTGDTIVFELGTYTFDSVSLSTIVTPYTLFPSSVDSAINLARLLQSIDSDGNVSNDVITIDKTLEALIPADINYSSLTFEADVESALSITLVSEYDAQLRLNTSILDNNGTIPIGAELPVADAGEDRNISVNGIVTLDGSGSSNADTYLWNILSKPSGSSAAIVNSTQVNPSFIADRNGSYIVELVINDINVSDTVTIIAYDSVVDNNTTNTAPVLSASTTVSVQENQTSALTLSASDDDNDTLSFYISGVDSADFNINTSTGVITFVQAPDYENKSSYSITVGVSDSSLSDEQNVTINISNVVETPQLSDTTLSIAENLAGGTNVGSVTIVTHGDTVISSFTLVGTGKDNFSISSSGVVTINNTLDYEITQDYNLSVKATNSVGDSSFVDLTIYVTNVADIKPVLVDTALNLREDAVVGDTVGEVTIDTEGDTPVTSTSIGGVGSANFALANDGTITVKAGASFDYETTNEYNLTAQLTNSVGTSNTVNVFVSVNNIIDEAPVIANSLGSIDENATVGTTVGTLTISYVGDSNITNISLAGTGSENFSISTAGTVTLSSADVLDFETTPSYTLLATATNTAGDSNDANITISINNIAEIPILINTSMSIMENEISGAEVGSILIDNTSPDSGDSPITNITLSGTGDGNFTVDNNGLVTLSVSSSIDYETTTQYTLSAVATNTAGNSASVTVTIDIEDYLFDPTLIAELNASDAESNDNFGNAIAIDGDYILAGASFEDAGSLADGGSVYLYKKDALGNVSQLSKLTANAPKTEEYFGNSVAMENGVIVVGAPDDSSFGAAYIFIVDPSDDSISLPAQKIVEGSSTVADGFGTSVAISGDYILVGAPGKASTYLYKLDVNNTASQTAVITAGLVSSDNYGGSVDIEDNYIVVGADKKDISSNDEGTAYVYELNTTNDNISLISAINSSTPVDYDYFGSSVGVSGDYVVVGGYGVDEVAANSGNAYLYKIDAGSISLVDTFAPNIAPNSLSDGDYFGYSLSIDGEYIAVGAHKKDLGATIEAGSVYVYHIDTGTDMVDLVKKLDSTSANSNDYFGSSVVVDGDFIGVGSVNDDTYATNGGKVFIYDGEPVP